MPRKPYAKMFTRRKDGYYQKKVGNKVLYDKDPETLYQKWQAAMQPNKPKFRDAAELYEASARERLGVKTWSAYGPNYKRLVDMFGDRDVDSITASDVMNVLQIAKAQGFSKTLIGVQKTLMNQILNEALAKEWILYNPAYSVHIPRGLKQSIRHAPTDQDIKEIVKHTDEPFGFLLYFLLCTGLRRGEALALTIHDIDWDNNEILVTKALSYVTCAHPILKETKTESSVRSVPIISSLRPKLLKYVRTLKGEILFPQPKSANNSGGGYMTEKTFRNSTLRYCAKYGINITAHMLRHGTATILFEAGVDVYTTKAILGHSNINTTMSIYTELREAQKKKSIEAFDAAMEKYGV